jgi:hypothetical protein
MGIGIAASAATTTSSARRHARGEVARRCWTNRVTGIAHCAITTISRGVSFATVAVVQPSVGREKCRVRRGVEVSGPMLPDSRARCYSTIGARCDRCKTAPLAPPSDTSRFALGPFGICRIRFFRGGTQHGDPKRGAEIKTATLPPRRFLPTPPAPPPCRFPPGKIVFPKFQVAVGLARLSGWPGWLARLALLCRLDSAVGAFWLSRPGRPAGQLRMCRTPAPPPSFGGAGARYIRTCPETP